MLPTRFTGVHDKESILHNYSQYGPFFSYEDVSITIHSMRSILFISYIDDVNAGSHSSLMMKASNHYKTNSYKVIDYEVYGIDNFKDYIYNTCKYPDIIWEYIETNDISEDSLKEVDDTEILSDLNTIQISMKSIRLKISKHNLKTPSRILVNTQLVDKKYDRYLRMWLGNYKWKLAYRASDNQYNTMLFHNSGHRRPTLIVIKSISGWIFGGYTTQLLNRLSM